MKKALILILLTLGVICLFTAFGCDNSQAPPSDPPGHTCEWKSTYSYDGTKHYFECVDPTCEQKSGLENHEHVLNFDDSVTPFKATKECKCGHGYELDYTTATPLTAQQTLDNLYDGSIVQLTFGDYQTLRISSKTDVILCADDFVNVELIIIEGTCKNIYIYNTVFDHKINLSSKKGGIKVEGCESLENFTVKNCTFKNNTGILTEKQGGTIKNTSIENCKFLDLKECSYHGRRNAIAMYECIDMTIKGCEFDGVGYNAIQLYVSESLTIKNNSFKNVKSRVLNLYVLTDNSAVDISSNVFYKEICSDNAESAVRKNSGVYILAGEKPISVGINVWEELPENTQKNFYNASINISEQLLLGNE